MTTTPIPRNLAELQTPAPLVDTALLAANLALMAEAWPGSRLRPHVKAHKCTELARHQRDVGHPGFTCATIREVEGMVAAGLGQELFDPLAGVIGVHPPHDDLAHLHVLEADAPLEAQRKHRVVQQVEQVEAFPGMVARHAQQAVADVVVHAEDVGVFVVHEVVGVAPVLGRPTHVPLPRRGVDLGIVHPVPLAVHDVVADFHVLDDLGHAKGHGPRPPG